MNYTANYHMPQWVKSDRIMMDDFNRMSTDIESGLNSNAQAARNAQTAANNAKTAADAAKADAAKAQTAADNAQAAAGAAQTAASKAQSTASSALTTRPYVVGTYTGDGTAGRFISLGFKPSLLILKCLDSRRPSGFDPDLIFCWRENCPAKLAFTALGFTVTFEYTVSALPEPNVSNWRYDYIAFK